MLFLGFPSIACDYSKNNASHLPCIGVFSVQSLRKISAANLAKIVSSLPTKQIDFRAGPLFVGPGWAGESAWALTLNVELSGSLSDACTCVGKERKRITQDVNGLFLLTNEEINKNHWI